MRAEGEAVYGVEMVAEDATNNFLTVAAVLPLPVIRMLPPRIQAKGGSDAGMPPKQKRCLWDVGESSSFQNSSGPVSGVQSRGGKATRQKLGFGKRKAIPTSNRSPRL